MPLSEHEQRLLEQIEQQLLTEDPKFASAVRASDPSLSARRRWILAGIGIVIGAAVMVLGIAAARSVALLGVPIIAAIGFLIAFGALCYGFVGRKHRSSRSSGEGSDPVGATAGAGAGKASAGQRNGLMDRLEERWRRRAN